MEDLTQLKQTQLSHSLLHTLQLYHVAVLHELQQAAQQHHHRLEHGRQNHLVLQLRQVYG